MSKPTADWERVGDRYYRKVHLYSPVFDADLELENCHISGAPFGGALGTTIESERNFDHCSHLQRCTVKMKVSTPTEAARASSQA